MTTNLTTVITTGIPTIRRRTARDNVAPY
jgi:hypothetical protein